MSFLQNHTQGVKTHPLQKVASSRTCLPFYTKAHCLLAYLSSHLNSNSVPKRFIAYIKVVYEKFNQTSHLLHINSHLFSLAFSIPVFFFFFVLDFFSFYFLFFFLLLVVFLLLLLFLFTGYRFKPNTRAFTCVNTK